MSEKSGTELLEILIPVPDDVEDTPEYLKDLVSEEDRAVGKALLMAGQANPDLSLSVSSFKRVFERDNKLSFEGNFRKVRVEIYYNGGDFVFPTD